jgi:AcrR family transcriptional regulator
MATAKPKGEEAFSGRRKRGRPSRLAEVLEQATRQFNAFGVAGAQLNKVADEVGVARGTLYHYFADREDLVYRCYRRSCAITAERIASAHLAESAGLARIISYVEQALGDKTSTLAIISDIDYLSEAHRNEIEAAHRANLSSLEAIIVDGQADGSVRSCDPKIVSQIIVGIQTWLSLAPTWGTGLGRTFDASPIVATLLSDGIAQRPEEPLQLARSFPRLPPLQKSAFDRAHAKEAKRDELVSVASRVFNRRSIDGTSIEDVAAELGATPGAVYHYFKTKNALLLACYERAYDIYSRQADFAAAAGETGLERLLYSVKFAVESAELAPLVVFTGAEHLPARGRRRIVNRLSEQIERGEAFYSQGIADGTLRALPVLPTVLALGGSVQRASQWHAWGDLYLQPSTAVEIVTLFAKGLRKR